MDGIWVQLALVVLLVFLNGVFAGSELALVSLREGQLQRLEALSGTGRALARLARDPNRFLATIQIGITLAGFLASASAAVSLAEPVEGALGFLGGADRAASILLVTVVLAYFTLVLGELAPKRIAMQRAERWGMLVARPLSGLARLMRPAVWFLSTSTDVAVRIFGGDPSREREAVTAEELRELVASHVTFSPTQRTIIAGAFEVAERSLRQVLRPRQDVFTLDGAMPCRAALRDLAASGHSRAPVVREGSLDEAFGVVHLRDMLTDDPACTVEAVVNPLRSYPESLGVLEALRDMQTHRTQLAAVVDEHGSVAGIVTVEDLVEEVVGEIYDETDRDLMSVRHELDGSIVLSGRFPVHDLPDLGVELPEGDYTTVAGFVLSRLGRVPEAPGDTVLHARWQFTVSKVGRRTIREVRVKRQPGRDDQGDSARHES